MTDFKLSYYELMHETLGIFFGKYPSQSSSPPTQPLQSGVKEKLFPTPFNQSSLHRFSKWLKEHNFGFTDYIGYLCAPLIKPDAQGEFEAGDIADALNSLYIGECMEPTKTSQVVTILSDLDPEFKLDLHARQTSAPQEAIDIFLLFVGNDKNEVESVSHSKRVVTTLGYKKRSESIRIIFNESDCHDTRSSMDSVYGKRNVLEVLKIGMFGYIAGPGEHLEQNENEIETVNAIRRDHTYEIANNIPVEIPLARKITRRTVAEEVGIEFDENADIKVYLIGIHDRPGRDPRYNSYISLDHAGSATFGYYRNSYSLIVAAVVPCKYIPEVLPEPLDSEECSKAQIITFEELYKEFKKNCRFIPAFPSHVENVEMVAEVLNEII